MPDDRQQRAAEIEARMGIVHRPLCVMPASPHNEQRIKTTDERLVAVVVRGKVGAVTSQALPLIQHVLRDILGSPGGARRDRGRGVLALIEVPSRLSSYVPAH